MYYKIMDHVDPDPQFYVALRLKNYQILHIYSNLKT